MSESPEPRFRIGELSRRSGTSPELLRAWERRYGLLHPVRSAGGLRLYTLDDVARVERMRRHLSSGIAAAEAAALAARDDQPADVPGTVLAVDAARTELAAALAAFDEPRAQALLDELFAAATLDAVLDEVVLPYLHELGARWQRGEASVAQEHFATNVVRGRLLGLARGWGRGSGPLAVLACLPDERHDLGLLAFGLALRAHGWRIAYLGADTPLADLTAAVETLDPALVALTAVTPGLPAAAADAIASLAAGRPVVLGGAGARELDHEALETVRLPDGIGAAAAAATRLVG